MKEINCRIEELPKLIGKRGWLPVFIYLENEGDTTAYLDCIREERMHDNKVACIKVIFSGEDDLQAIKESVMARIAQFTRDIGESLDDMIREGKEILERTNE